MGPAAAKHCALTLFMEENHPNSAWKLHMGKKKRAASMQYAARFVAEINYFAFEAFSIQA
jgi:hypothetical protein